MKLKRTIRSLCLSVQICCLLAGSTFDMAVLCRAENGHVAIEPAGADGCAKLSTRHSAEDAPDSTQHGLSSTDDCGDCLDVQLSIGSAVVLKQHCRISTASSASVAAIFAEDAADSLLHPLPPELAWPSPHFAPLRSIVLLI